MILHIERDHGADRIVSWFLREDLDWSIAVQYRYGQEDWWTRLKNWVAT